MLIVVHRVGETRPLTTLVCILELCEPTPFWTVVGAIFFGIGFALEDTEVVNGAAAARGITRERVLKGENLRLEGEEALSTNTIGFISQKIERPPQRGHGHPLSHR